MESSSSSHHQVLKAYPFSFYDIIGNIIPGLMLVGGMVFLFLFLGENTSIFCKIQKFIFDVLNIGDTSRDYLKSNFFSSDSFKFIATVFLSLFVFSVFYVIGIVCNLISSFMLEKSYYIEKFGYPGECFLPKNERQRGERKNGGCRLGQTLSDILFLPICVWLAFFPIKKNEPENIFETFYKGEGCGTKNHRVEFIKTAIKRKLKLFLLKFNVNDLLFCQDKSWYCGCGGISYCGKCRQCQNPHCRQNSDSKNCECGSLDENLNEVLKEIDEGKWMDFLIMLHFVHETECPHLIRMYNWQAYYGFFRNMSFIFTILMWTSLLTVFLCAGWPGFSCFVVFSLFAFICFKGFDKYYKRYAKEVIYGFLVNEDQDLLRPYRCVVPKNK